MLRIVALLLFPLLIVLPLLTLQSDIWANAHGWMVLATAEESQVPAPPGGGGGGREGASGANGRSRCNSRVEHLMYRPASRHFPPPAELVRAWDAYQELHRRCTRGRSWADTFRNATASAGASNSSPEAEERCRFLYYEEGFGGLGNRLLSLVSAFAYAMLTQRVLVMDSHSNLAHMLCEPFHGSSWLLPDDFPYWEMPSLPHLGDALDRGGLGNVTALYVQLLHEQSQGDQRFFCPDVQRGLHQVPWVSWRSNQYYVPRFFTMAGFWDSLTPLFPDATLAFTHLSRRILLPQNLIWDRILRVYWSYLAFSKQQVGVQVRRHSASPDFDPAAHARMVDCLTDHGLLPNVTASSMDQQPAAAAATAATPHHGNPSTSSPLLIKQQQAASARPGAPPSVVVVLVASLQAGYSQGLKRRYIDRTTADGTLVRVHQVTQDGTEWASYQQAVDAFTEMWLLSFSDQLATSSWSTFGYIAQGLGGLHPYLMNIKGDLHNDGLPPCFTGQSIEPCCHFPFLDADATCGNDTRSPQHLAWIQTHVRSCQDETRGVQLVA